MSYNYLVDDSARYRASISGLRAFVDQILRQPRPSTATAGGIYRIRTPNVDQFTEYETYKENWDGFDAEPITRETVDAARQFWRLLPREVPVPDVAPGADGTIGFEWRKGAPDDRKIIVVEIGPGALVTARMSHANGYIEIFPQRSLMAVMRDVVTSLLS
jgi:hypothetical protein